MNKRFNAVGLLLMAMALPCMAAQATTEQSASITITQQNGTCTGTVVDNSGESLTGASVIIKGTTKGTTVDANGRFSISGVKAGQTLRITFIGYKPVEVKWEGTPLNIVLEEDESTLDEAIVIGYGTVRKADLAGSVSVMDSKSFRDQPITQVSEALQGRMAGVLVESSGIPGGDVKIRIRGNSSVSKSNDPLYVVDGIVRESGLEGINPDDIQSIQVLKDASSTAIYGSRGANGVVLVQTKTGREGRTDVVFDGSWGWSTAYNLPEMMNAQQYAEALVKYKGISQAELKPYLDGTDKGVDWLDEVLRTGFTQNYKVALSQGSERVQNYFSANYMDNNGVVADTEFERYAFKGNMKSHLTKWLDLTVDVNASHSSGKGNRAFEMSQNNPLWIAQNFSPTMHVLDEKGNYSHDLYNSIQNSPVGLLKGDQAERQRNVFNGHADLRFNILPGLTFTTTNGVDWSDRKNYSLGIIAVSGKSSMANGDVQTMMLQSTNNLTYDHTWNKAHHLTATAVWEATSSENRTMNITGNNLQAESVGWWDVSNAASRDASNGYSKWSLLSGVARVMYSYQERYMLTGTFRADGSSRFSNQKWGYFPSIAAAWTISNEKFMDGVRDKMNLFKLRASYGIVGNQDISPYSTLGLMSGTSYNYGTTSGYTGYWASNIATPDLTWEKTKQFDLGLDFGWLDNRITLTVDYFMKKTSDALLTTTSPMYLGGTSYWVNAGEVSNTGLDVALTAHVVKSRNFNWSTTLTGTYIKNEVTKLTAQEPFIYGSTPMQGTMSESATVIMEGEPIGTFYGYKWAGLNADGLDSFYKADGTITTTPESSDRQVLGHANPDFTLGWNNTLSWKNWDLNAFFNAGFGAKRLNLVSFAMHSMVGASKFVTAADYIDNMYGVSSDPIYCALDAVGNNNLGNSTKWLENADYFRLQNLSLSYNLKKEVAKFADLRFSFSVQNAFTITKYSGVDPTGSSFAGGRGNVDHNAGIDMGTYPTPRTFTLGVRASF